MAIRSRRHSAGAAVVLLVVVALLLGGASALPAPPGAGARAPAHGSPVAAAVAPRAGAPLAAFRTNDGTPAANGFSGAAAGSLVRTVFPGYNATLPGNFPGSVQGWQVGTPAYVPATQELWLPNRAVSVNGIPAPPIAPAIVYNATTNQFAGFDLAVENTSAFLYDPNNGFLYSADWANDTVGVIDPTTGGWAHAAIPVGALPNALAIDDSTNTLYVANYGSANVTVVNTATNAIAVSGISTGPNPHSEAFDSFDNSLFVADGGDSWVWSIDTLTDSSSKYSPVTGIPGGVAYSRAAGTIAITSSSGSKLTILNSSLPVSVAVTVVGPGMRPVATNINGSEFVVGNSTGSDLVIVNSSTGSIVGPRIIVGKNITQLETVPDMPSLVAWAAGSRTLTLVDLALEKVAVTSATLEPEPWSIASDPSTNRVYVADDAGGSVLVLNATTGLTAAPPIAVPSGALSVVVDPTSGTLYVGAWSAVYSFNTATDSPMNHSSPLSGGNSPVVVDAVDHLLWVANPTTGIHALQLGSLNPRYSVPIRLQLGSQNSMTLDPALSELFVVNQSAGALEAVNALNGAIESPDIAAGTAPNAVAFDPSDNELYVAGANISVIDPMTYSTVGASIPLPTHSGAPGIVYDWSRGYLYVTTENASTSSRVSSVIVLDGSSVSASHGSQVSIVAGQLATDALPIMLPGGAPPSFASVWVANAQSGTLGIIASPPSTTFFAAAPSAIDIGQTTQFLLGYSGGTGPDSISYSGLPSGCVSRDTPLLNCTPVASGTYPVTATVTDSFGSTSQATTVLTVGAVLSVRATVSPWPLPVVDSGTNLTVTAVATGGTPGYTYAWNFGDGVLSSGPVVTHAYSTPGTYLMNVTVTDSVHAEATDSVVVEVNPPPTAVVTASPTNATDANTPLDLGAVVSGGTGGGSGSWSFGDATNASGLAVVHAWARAGTYLVVFRYSDGVGRTVTESLGVSVAPPLTATFSVGTPGASAAAGTAVPFSVVVSGGLPEYNVSWSFGDGSYGYGLSTTHAYAAGGSYSVRATLTDGAGAHVNATIPLSVSGSVGGPATGPGSQFFLGVLLGVAVGAIVLLFAGRSKKSSPHPPSPYVPPEGTLPET